MRKKQFLNFVVCSSVFLAVLAIFAFQNISGTWNARNATVEAAEFSDSIDYARKVVQESLIGSLKYPLHSLVVYRVATVTMDVMDNVSPTDWVMGSSYEGLGSKTKNNKYHYALPKEWLATKRGQVKLVVLLMRGDPQVLGTYSLSQAKALSIPYHLKFVDLSSGRIVAKYQFVQSDPDVRKTNDTADYHGWPSESQVEEQIRLSVRFGEE